MFRWPLALLPLSLGADGHLRDAALEVTPRGAVFTLAALSHIGHPAHLALVDAYLKGQVRLTPTAAIGDDSRRVAASLAAPLLAAHELSMDRCSLGDLILLPRDPSAPDDADQSTDGRPTRSADAPRFLFRTAAGGWQWVRAAERFGAPGCLGTRAVGLGDWWHQIVVELPDRETIKASVQAGTWPAPISAEVRAPSRDAGSLDPGLVAGLRALTLARFGAASFLVHRAVDRLAALGDAALVPLARADLLGERLGRDRDGQSALATASEPTDLVATLARPIAARQPVLTAVSWGGLTVDVSLVPDLDGYQTLCLLPPADLEPSSAVDPMCTLTWAVLEGLIGRPLAERRSEPIALRLVADGGRSTTLDVGASLVLVRNQTVFTAWIGSDGRVMLKLFPSGGM